MIDLIKLRMTNLSPADVKSVVDRNHLQTNMRGGAIYYDNSDVRNVRSFFISVTQAGDLRIEGSLHKFWNFYRTGRNTNHDLFTISDALAALELMADTIGVDVYAMQVKYYEIGLNLYTPRPPIEYMREMRSIGSPKSLKRLYINPRYSHHAVVITEFYNRIKNVYKAYDKRHEMREKRRTDIPEYEILRIEFIRKGITRTTVRDLIAPASIDKMTRQFIRDWRSVTMPKAIRFPPGLYTGKRQLYSVIIDKGIEAAREIYQADYEGRKLSEKQYRRVKEVFRDWIYIRKTVKLLPSDIDMEYRTILTNTYELAAR